MSEQIDSWAPVLPRAVREQVARAEQLAREAGIANVPPPEGEAPSAEPPPEVTPEPPVAEPGPHPQAQPVQPELPLDTPAQPAPPAAPEVNWEQRYNTLQGKYNAEVPELRGQLRSMQEMLTAMNASLHGPTIPPGNPPSRGNGSSRLREIPQTDIDNYGQDLIDAAQRWAEFRVAPLIETYENRLAQIENRNQQLYHAVGASRVDQELNTQLPNWRTVNDDPNFHAWLTQVDLFSGRTRQSMLEEAYNAGDAARTAAFFHSYLREQTAVSPTPPGIRSGQTGNGAMPVGPAAATPLEMLAVPGRGPVSPTQPASSAPGNKRIWTGAEITAFYDQKRRGLWNGRDAEVAAIEHDLTQAPLEGRIRG